MGNLSINSYNIFQAIPSGIHVYDTSGNYEGTIPVPSGVFSYYETTNVSYYEDFTFSSSASDWREISGPGDIYDFTQGYMRNNNSSNTYSIAVSYAMYEADDFDLSLKVMNYYSGGGRCDNLSYFFRSIDEPTPSSPCIQIYLGTHSVAGAARVFRFNVYDSTGGLLKSVPLNKWDYSTTLGTWYWGRVKKEGADFYFKHWRDGDGEPETWDATETISGTGRFYGPISVQSRTGNTSGGTGYDNIGLYTTKTDLVSIYNEISSVASTDDYLYAGTTISGVYIALASGTLSNPLVQYKYDSVITANEVVYLHAAGDFLCVTTVSGVDRYNVVSGTRIYTTTENAAKCFQTSTGEFYYITSGEAYEESFLSLNIVTFSLSGAKMSVSDVTTGSAAFLVDGVLTGGSFWEDDTSPFPAWCAYDFGESNNKVVLRYSLSAGDTEPGRMPKSWLFQGSNSGLSWTTLDSVYNEISWTAQETREYSFLSTTAYRYYRLYITAGNHATILRMFDWSLSGKTIYSETSYTDSELNAVYDRISNWSSPDYIYDLPFVTSINDIYVTEGTSLYGSDNVIFVGTDDGVHVIEERKGDEIHSRTKRFYLK